MRILFFSLLMPTVLFAQELLFEQEQYPFPVTFYGIEPQLGFMQANSKYHPDFGDIDNDGDSDLILGVSNAYEILCLNIGSSEQPEYQFISNQYVDPGEYSNVCPPVIVDIDNDNDLDIFTGFNNGYLVYFENIGTPELAEYEYVTGDYLGVILEGGCPSHDFVDIDDDGDYDYFAGSISQMFGQIIFFENTGSPDSADLELTTENFASIDVGGKSAPEFCDIDGDGDYDLFIGCEDGTVWYYENIGTPDSCDFEYVTNYYDSIDVGNMSVPRFCDIDGDGDFDLFVANESQGATDDFEGDITYYENTGSANNPQFTYVTGQYLFMDMSQTTNPSAVDIDNDGLIELLVGISGGQIVLLENEGMPDAPSFYFSDSSFQDLNLTYQPVLSFADLDSDGDLDFIVLQSGFTSFVNMYENIGSSTSPQYEFWQNIASGDDWQGGGCDICDIDGDGDFDLFFGDGYNRIQYYKNIGNSSSPVFRFETENYLNQPYMGGYLFPRFNDIDHDSDFDLIMGQNYVDTYIIFWRNIGSPQIADFMIEDTLAIFEYPEVLMLRPCLGDIDNDGDDDMFVGEGGGAMLFFRNQEYSSVNREPGTVNRTFILHPNYPNPFNAQTVIPFTLDRAGKVKIDIFDITGRSVGAKGLSPLQARYSAGMHEFVWNAEGVASGVYLVRLETPEFSRSQRAILLK